MRPVGRQYGEDQHGGRRALVAITPGPGLVVIEAEFAFGGLKRVLDGPAPPPDGHQRGDVDPGGALHGKEGEYGSGQDRGQEADRGGALRAAVGTSEGYLARPSAQGAYRATGRDCRRWNEPSMCKRLTPSPAPDSRKPATKSVSQRPTTCLY